MRTRILIVCQSVCLAVSAATAQTPLGNAFTYQGQLKNGGSPAGGSFNIVFRLWNDPTLSAPANQVGPTLMFDGVGGNPPPVNVTNGLFTVQLNFGAAAFNGSKRWLSISVNGTTLISRQELTAAPNAQYALSADRLDGLDSSAFLQSIPVPLTLSGASDTHIIRAENTSTANFTAGVLGVASGGSGLAVGGRFTSASTDGYGVWATASAVTGGTYGGRFDSDSIAGIAVIGTAGAATGFTYGGWFQSNSMSGRGVLGFAQNSEGVNYGVHGQSNSTSGVGVYGFAPSFTGPTIGVFGRSYSPTGYGGYFDGRGYFSGNVGIGYGADNPSHLLTVQSTGVNTMRLIGPTGTYQYGARLNFGDGNYAYVEEDLDDRLSLLASRFNILGCNVGIGVAEPTFQLQLSANSAAKPTSSAWTIASDRRLKKNITPISCALDQLMQLHGVTYQWKDPASQGGMAGTYTGMIAQDVEKVFPEWIGTGRDGYKHLTVIGFEGLTVEALRQLRDEKDAQMQSLRAEKDTENAELRARIELLEHTIQQLIAKQSDGSR